MPTLADLLPPWLRRLVYILLGILFGVEAIWDVVPSGVEGRVLATLAVLGFTLAQGNTPSGDRDAR